MLLENSTLRLNVNHYSLDFINSKKPQTAAINILLYVQILQQEDNCSVSG